MPKKKSKKKRKLDNPHKFSEQKLKDKINSLISRQSVDEAYDLTKVLLERFESDDNISLFKSILKQRIEIFKDLGKPHEAQKLITEAKKRFPGPLFQEIDKHLQLLNLNDSQLLEHFSDKEEIPNSFHHRIAEILFFNEKPDRQFIKQHNEFKDVFYVKEAFLNGYQPDKTPKILSAIKPDSPYRSWYLIHKGIQAFLASDSESLELIPKKMPQGYFPAFLVSKLRDYLAFLEGKTDTSAIGDEELELVKTLFGEHCTLVAALSGITNQSKTSLNKHIPRLSRIRKQHPEQYGFILYLLLNDGHGRHQWSRNNSKFELTLLEQIANPEELAINTGHLYLKLNEYRNFDNKHLEKMHERLIRDIEESNSSLFDTESLKAEIVFHYARSFDIPDKKRSSIFGSLFERHVRKDLYDRPISNLEKAIDYSDHNPKIHTLLIEYYRKTNVKTSVINKAVDRFLTKFPSEPDGFNLAGKIAFQNKTYKKAIEFFNKAKKFAPLDREIDDRILNCFEGIINKRNKSNHHLIDKDLESALPYIDPKQSTLVERYTLLETKALLKKYSLAVIDLKTLKELMFQKYPSPPENGRIALKLLLLIIETQETARYMNQVLDPISTGIRENLNADNYLVFLRHALDNNSKTPSGFLDLMSDLTLHFIQQEKTDRSLTELQHLELILLSISNNWNRSFVGFVCLAVNNYPGHKGFILLQNLILSKISRPKIKSILLDEVTVAWLISPSGKKTIDKLAYYSDFFDDLDSFLRESQAVESNEVIDEIKLLWEDYPFSFRWFGHYLLEDCHKNDFLDLKAIKKTFDLPILTAFSKAAVFHGHDFKDGDDYADFDSAHKQAEQDEKEWQEMQKREKEEQKKQREMKKKIEEEIESKNDQIDLFDIIDDEEC